MSKHKKRDRDREQGEGGNQFGLNVNNNPFGIDPMQLMNLLGNMDMGRVNTMINTMNKNGFDINSANNMMNNNFENITNTKSQNNQMNQMNGMPEVASMKNSKFDINTLNALAEKMGGGRIGINNNERPHSDKNLKVETNIGEKKGSEVEENLQLLLSIRNIVDFSKKGFIDKIIEKYKNGEFD